MKYKLIFTVIVLTVCFCFASRAQAIREIAVQNLGDGAIASYDYYGPVIYYDPDFAASIGNNAMLFCMSHEYGHHNLGHVLASIVQRNDPYVQTWLSLNMENEADKYAVNFWIRNGNVEVIRAGYKLFFEANLPGDYTHPSSSKRARNILNYYYQATGYELFN